MTKFTISDSATADLLLTRENGTRTESTEFTMMTGTSMKEPESWVASTELDRYFDVVLRIIDHLWERHHDDLGFISSPGTDKHQFLKWLLVEEIATGKSQWIKGFRLALKAADKGDPNERVASEESKDLLAEAEPEL